MSGLLRCLGLLLLAVLAGCDGRDPARAGWPESRSAVMSVFPQRYTFGGDTLPVVVRLASPAARTATFTVRTELPAGSVDLPSGPLEISPGQSELRFALNTRPVAGIEQGLVEVTWTNADTDTGSIAGGQLATLLPEPTALQLTIAPGSVPGGQPTTLQLTTTPTYPIDLVVSLSAQPPWPDLPVQLNVPAGGAGTPTPVATRVTAVPETVQVTARLRAAVDIETLQIQTTASSQLPLSVSVQGGGTVSSEPPGIDCGSVCAMGFNVGTRLVLTPQAAPGQRFYAWTGDGDCSDGVVTLDSARSCTAVFQSALAPYLQSPGWQQLGAPLATQSEVDPAPSLARDGAHPVVAHVEALGGDVARLYVKRLEGNGFVTLGGTALNAGSITAASEPALVTSVTGQPVVAWIQGDGIQQNVFVARFDGSTWHSVGAAGVPLNQRAGSRASQPAIALDAQRQPMVAWLEDGAVQFRRFDGTAWVAAAGGAGPAVGGVVDQLRMGADLDGEPVIAWREGTGAAQALRVVRGFDFTPLGAQVVPGGGRVDRFALFPQVGGAVVAYAVTDRPVTLRVVEWSSGQWADRGTMLANDPRRLTQVDFARFPMHASVVLEDSAAGSTTLALLRRDGATQAWVGAAAALASTTAERPLTVSHEWVAVDSPLLATSHAAPSERYALRVRRFFP
ncbi:MAG: hypothetical protein AB7U92_00635 [Piscinibacter sp.]|uniref:hypothetical protein n=1 Tax=Piscinibacter sp. TaxID=1903157 RepID=UPI003D0C702C